VKNEAQIQIDLEYSEKHSKTWKMRNAHWMYGEKTENYGK
jgi:hypothetical protein